MTYKKGLVTTTVCKTKVSEIENKIQNISSLVTYTVLNTKISKVEHKIPNNLNKSLLKNLIS